jgi:hypothetical protein
MSPTHGEDISHYTDLVSEVCNSVALIVQIEGQICYVYFVHQDLGFYYASGFRV